MTSKQTASVPRLWVRGGVPCVLPLSVTTTAATVEWRSHVTRCSIFYCREKPQYRHIETPALQVFHVSNRGRCYGCVPWPISPRTEARKANALVSAGEFHFFSLRWLIHKVTRAYLWPIKKRYSEEVDVHSDEFSWLSLPLHVVTISGEKHWGWQHSLTNQPCVQPHSGTCDVESNVRSLISI